MKTLQQVFNQAFRGLRKQGWKKSVAADGTTCMYRGPNGLRCAIGHAIPNSRYMKKFEEYSVINGTILRAALGVGTGYSGPIDLHGVLFSLQNCHDSARGRKDMERSMLEFAQRYGLTVPK